MSSRRGNALVVLKKVVCAKSHERNTLEVVNSSGRRRKHQYPSIRAQNAQLSVMRRAGIAGSGNPQLIKIRDSARELLPFGRRSGQPIGGERFDFQLAFVRHVKRESLGAPLFMDVQFGLHVNRLGTASLRIDHDRAATDNRR